MLMALRVKGRCTEVALAAATGWSEVEVENALQRARAEGMVGSSAVGWALTESGQRALAEGLSLEPIDRAALGALYPRFLTVDAELKARITAWQVGGRTPQRVSDDDLVAAGEAAVAIAGELAAAVPRLRSYAARLEAVVRAVADGDARFVASPRIDSLHQVWFELHEDLLATLGRSRTS